MVELALSPSRLFPLHQLLSAKGRQGTRGPFLIGCRVRRPVPPTPCSRSAPGGVRGRSWRLWSSLTCTFRAFTALIYLSLDFIFLKNERQGSEDRLPWLPSLPFPGVLFFSQVLGSQRGQSGAEEVVGGGGGRKSCCRKKVASFSVTLLLPSACSEASV